MQNKALAVGLACALFAAEGVRHKRSGQSTMAGLHVHNDHADAEDFLLVFKPGADDASIKAVCQGRCSFEGRPSRGGVAIAKVHGRDATSEVLSANSEQVQLVEADTLQYLIPEIPGTEEAVTATSAAATPWGLGRIGAPSKLTGKGVTVFVQDTGVHVGHTEFGGRAVAALDMTKDNDPVECSDTDQDCAVDRQGHGTHCAGTAAGSSYGVAPEARVRAVKTLSDQGSGSLAWQTEAIDWIAVYVTEHSPMPSVISMSLGGSGTHPSYQTAIDAVTEVGVTVSVAAGNSNADACGFSPAFVLTAITVGSTTINDKRSYFSNFGECVQIWAPGSDIKSAAHDSNDGSATMSGTSMACPHVSGAAALVLQENPSATPDQVLQMMKNESIQGLITDLKCGDVNFFLHVGDGAPPQPDQKQPEPECVPTHFVCPSDPDGCEIKLEFVGDGYCDCVECEDEPSFNCTSCARGCPSKCGQWKKC